MIRETEGDMSFIDRAKVCSIDGCTAKHVARGYCGKHYKRWERWGDASIVNEVHYNSPEELFAVRTRVLESGCIEWTGARSSDGHGQIRVNGKMVGAHRYAWERVNGPIPPGAWIDHKCWNGMCVNPEHLRPATPGQNNSYLPGARRSNALGIRNVYRKGNGYIVQVRKDGFTFGSYFQNLEEAEREAERLRDELFGEFAGRA